MDINISYYLAEHGWSTCWINTKDKTYEISITHIFHEDPIEECMNCLLKMINGQKNSEFKWYGEPGGERIQIDEIPTQKHMVKVSIDQFNQDIGDEIKEFEKGTEFLIKKTLLVTMFYYEFKKIFELLKDKHYKENRNSDFPFESFKLFEKTVLEYLN
ncbi:hypothetical protein [uncultured Aquimarina sp.]|uniref:hypothetical protein n=1 Tax=uncultured Aquimarina sp. TaxID=575652 RepID=UPI0026144EB7|nr:hypothetical protein [uncultured Aquimarina sp.]